MKHHDTSDMYTLSGKPPVTLGRFLLSFVRVQWKSFALMMVFPMFWAVEQNVFPYIIKMIVDTITHYEGDRSAIFAVLSKPLWVGALVWLALIINWRLLDVFDYWTIPKLQAAVRLTVTDYVLGHSHRYFADHFAGSIANKISDISRGIWEICMFLLRRVVPTLVSLLASVAILLFIAPVFAAVLGGFFFLHMCICLFLSGAINRLSEEHSECRSALQGSIVDILSNSMNVRLFARHSHEMGYLKTRQGEEMRRHKLMLWSMFKLKVLLELPSSIMIFGLVMGLVYSWQQQWITAGDFVFIITVAFSLMHMTWWLGMELPSLFREIGVCRQALGLIGRSHEIEDAKDAQTLVVTHGKIVFEDVDFSYMPDKAIFQGKNVVIEPGQKVGLVGFSGSGKSTFVNLILRYYDLDKGSISIDGKNIAKVTQDSLRGQIAMIPQDAALFHRTLMENIRYGRLEATDEEVVEASKRANAHEFITRIEQAYEALVGERGIKLSGGQRQRIAIARAILKNAPILILDEATSSLDSVTERYIQKAFAELMRGKTTIVVAHRLSTLADMDRILVFRDGHIIEDGSHAELLRLEGHYAYLWRMQAGGFLPEYEEGTDEALAL